MKTKIEEWLDREEFTSDCRENNVWGTILKIIRLQNEALTKYKDGFQYLRMSYPEVSDTAEECLAEVEALIEGKE